MGEEGGKGGGEEEAVGGYMVGTSEGGIMQWGSSSICRSYAKPNLFP